MQPIESLEPGDLVYAYDPATGEVGVFPIEEVFVNPGRELLELEAVTADGDLVVVEATAQHPIWVAERDGRAAGWVDLEALDVGDVTRLRDGTPAVVTRLATTRWAPVTYNLQVAVAHTYFVGPEGLLVHNCIEELKRGFSEIAKAAEAASDPAKVLEGLTSKHVGKLAADPAHAAKVLSEAEQLAGPRMHAANFGKAVERHVARDVDNHFRHMLRHTGGPSSEDFVGVGAHAGRTFDITTFSQQASHYGRSYGHKLELILYNRPSPWP